MSLPTHIYTHSSHSLGAEASVPRRLTKSVGLMSLALQALAQCITRHVLRTAAQRHFHTSPPAQMSSDKQTVFFPAICGMGSGFGS